MHTSADEILHYDLIAAWRKNRPEPFWNFLHRAMEVTRAAQYTQDQKQHRKKREEHIEGHGLRQRDAAGNDTKRRTEEPPQEC